MEYTYREISSQRAINESEFPKGLIDFNFNASGINGFVPSKSYMKIKLTITGKGAAVLRASDCTSLCDDPCGALFNNVSFKCGSQSISEISNFVAQASILSQRTGMTNQWLETIGYSNSFLEPNLNKRISRLVRDANSELDDDVQLLPVSSRADIDSAACEIKADTSVVEGIGTNFITILGGTNDATANAKIRNNF